MLIWLHTYCQQAELTASEQQALKTVEKQLEKRRRKAFRQMRQWLNSNRYQALTADFKAWLCAPRYQALAQIPIQLVLPDLLLPLMSEVLQHPGWLVGTLAQSGVIVTIPGMDLPQINQLLAEQGTVLHDLRKRIKHFRYQAEFFLDLYDPAYADRVKEFRQLQDLLGALQDEAVISDLLAKILGRAWPKRLPALAQQFDRERLTLWQQWQPLQSRYLEAGFRHMQVLSPAARLPDNP
jgi:CHAD domain-containing protein